MKFRKYYSVIGTRWLLLIDFLLGNLYAILATKADKFWHGVVWTILSIIWFIIFGINLVDFIQRWLKKRKGNPTVDKFNEAINKQEDK